MPIWLIYCHFEDSNYKGLIFVIYWHRSTAKLCYLACSKNTSWVCLKVSEGSLEVTSLSDILQNIKSGRIWDRLRWVNSSWVLHRVKCSPFVSRTGCKLKGFKSFVQGQNISNIPCPNFDLHLKGRVSCVAMTSIRSFQYWKIKKKKKKKIPESYKGHHRITLEIT